MPKSICVQNLKSLGVPVPNLWNGVQNLQILPLNSLLTHSLWGNFVVCEMGHVKIYLCTKFDVFSYTRSKFMKGGPKFTNLAPEPPPHPTWGNFVIHEMWHVNIYPWTKFEVSSFTRSQFREDPKIYKFGPWTPRRPLLGYFWSIRWDLPSIGVQNLKFLTLPVTNLWISLSYIGYSAQTRLTVGMARSGYAGFKKMTSLARAGVARSGGLKTGRRALKARRRDAKGCDGVGKGKGHPSPND